MQNNKAIKNLNSGKKQTAQPSHPGSSFICYGTLGTLSNCPNLCFSIYKWKPSFLQNAVLRIKWDAWHMTNVLLTKRAAFLCSGFWHRSSSLLSLDPFKTPLIIYTLVAQMVKNLRAAGETQVQSQGQEDPLEEGMAIHSSILAWRIPWTEEPRGQ